MTAGRAQRIVLGTGLLGVAVVGFAFTSAASARAGAQLLFFEGRAAQPVGRDVVVVDSLGQVFQVSRALEARRLDLEAAAGRLESVAPDGAGGIWGADDGGRLLHFGRDGGLIGVSDAPFAFPALAADPGRGDVWAVRSARRFDFGFAPGPAPLAVRIASRAAGPAQAGEARPPEHALLRTLANAGHLVPAGDTLFFAPFIRDEVLALLVTGDTIWRMTRGLPQSRAEPRFELVEGRAVIDYHPVNLGLSRGPDGRLYLLSTPGYTMEASRLDVVMPRTGAVIATHHFPTPFPTVAVDARQQIRTIEPDALLGGVPAPSRRPAPDFDLPVLDRDRLRLADLRGKVVLVNLWASWCTPCRREMPALDTLRRRLPDTDFAFVAISEDLDRNAARRFVEEFGFTFPVPLGEGKLERVFYYPGLPFTVLIDRQGRIVRTWIGEIPPEDISLLEAAIRRELAVSAEEAHDHH